jgi:hypothetical protein
MGFFHNLMNKLGRYRLIPDRRTGEDYMHRYYLFLKDRSQFPFNVTLHKIVKSDDPIFHDHPWPYITVVLKGGYWEHTPVFNREGKLIAEFQTWRGPGSVIKRKAGDYHWLELEEGSSATTLFFMGPQQREWGFLVNKDKTKTRWIQWENYLSNYKEYHTRYIEPKIQSMSKKKK